MAAPGAGTRAAESIRRSEQIYDAKEGWGYGEKVMEKQLFFANGWARCERGWREIRNPKREIRTSDKAGRLPLPSPFNPGRCAVGCLAENRLSLRN